MSAPPLSSSSAFAAAPEVNFEHLLSRLDGQFAHFSPQIIGRFRFVVDSMEVEVRRIQQQQGYRFLITARIGYLPFTVESPERRQAIRAIIEATRALPTVRFSVDHAGKISAGGLFETRKTAPSELVFYPLTVFLQEARPFMQLIGRYLQA